MRSGSIGLTHEGLCNLPLSVPQRIFTLSRKLVTVVGSNSRSSSRVATNANCSGHVPSGFSIHLRLRALVMLTLIWYLLKH